MAPRATALVLALLALALGALHLALAGSLELSPDEAYYWSWAQAPALAYPDHPPLVAWLIAGGTWVAGDTTLGVRWPFVLLGTLLTPLAFAAGRRAGLRPGFALLAAAAVGTSLLGSGAALLATPDTPLAFGWLVGLLGLLGAAGARPSRSAWPLAACGIAIACLSKLTGVLLPLAAAGWLASPAGAGWRRRPQPWLALAAGLAAAAPVWLADAAGGGPTGFQLAHGLWSPALTLPERLGNLGAYLGAQLGLLSPLLAAAVVAFLARPRLGEPSRAALWWAAALPWAAFGLAAPLAPPEANWPGVAHLGGLLGAAWAVQEARARDARWARPGWIAAALGLAVATSLVVHLHLARPFLPLDRSDGRPFAGSTDPAARLHGWESLARALERRGEPVCPGWYGAAALLRFHGFRGRLAPGCDGADGGGAAARAAPRPASGVLLWLEPSAGPGLPGGFRVLPPAGCAELPMDPATFDPRLVQPPAPVRLRRLDCPGARSRAPGRLRTSP
jgi:4-amino-4-deoxy-L-arabinose transferase-like glycosyltransferase